MPEKKEVLKKKKKKKEVLRQRLLFPNFASGHPLERFSWEGSTPGRRGSPGVTACHSLLSSGSSSGNNYLFPFDWLIHG